MAGKGKANARAPQARKELGSMGKARQLNRRAGVA
jgi:hypothetical protein